MKRSKVYIALLHSPMYNKRMETITTSVTNLDLHDIARTARTYEVNGFYIIHPADGQRELVNDILSYWQQGYGAVYNPDRREAFKTLRLGASLEEVIDRAEQDAGCKVFTVATDARTYPNTISYSHLKDLIHQEDGAYLILFGTGWGMLAELVKECDYILEPVESERSYNHLSVRAAAAIIMDRLLGEYWFAR